ncbi:MAG: hypothetical protein WHT07_10735 [Desulfobaccales bacterium]
MTAAEVAKALAGDRCPQRAGRGWLTWCPVHVDKNPSLSVSEDNGKLLVFCHAGCAQEKVILELKARNLWPRRNGLKKSRPYEAKGYGPARGNGGSRLGELDAVYPYRDASGNLLFEVCRFRTPDGGKTFRQRRPDPEKPGEWIWNLNGVPLVLYRLPELVAADPAIPVFVTEGEKDADRLANWGQVTTTNPMGAGKWREEYNQCLRGRRVVILPDNDPPGRDHSLHVAQALYGVAASVKILNLPRLPEKGDISDWIDAGGTIEKLLSLAEATPEWEPPVGTTEEGKNKRESQAEQLIKLAADAELFHDSVLKAYATIPVGRHYETWPVRSHGFRGWLQERFYRAHGKPAGGQALQDAIDLVAARAIYDGPEVSTFVRVAHIGDRVYVDLADAEWRAVEISPEGWRVVERPTVKFLRPRGMASLPVPEPGDSLAVLRPFVNCQDEEWPLVVAWLVGALSRGPYPILMLQGEQGSAKTTTARVLKALIDPSMAPQRAAPRNQRDLMISAANSWVLSFDNLSGLEKWLSNAFCRLATGGGLGTRELYSDADEVLFDAMRPLILNGIDSVAEKGDLAQREILINCPYIPKEARKPEARFWAEFNATRPLILGALFTAVSTALANRNRVNLQGLPRMADFAEWVTAAEPALPWEPGTFLAAYDSNEAQTSEEALEADPVAMAVLALMKDREVWQGTASELLDALEGLVRESTLKSKLWPKAPNALSNRLRQVAPLLRARGVEIERGKSGVRFIMLRKGVQKTAQTAQTAQT